MCVRWVPRIYWSLRPRLRRPLVPRGGDVGTGENQLCSRLVDLNCSSRMNLSVLSASDVEELLPMRTCIDLMREALKSLTKQEVLQPLRSSWSPPGVPGAFT